MTVAVAQPPVVSEMYAAVSPFFVGSAASAFSACCSGPSRFFVNLLGSSSLGAVVE